MEAAAAAQEDRDKPYACDSESWRVLFWVIVVLKSYSFVALWLLEFGFNQHSVKLDVFIIVNSGSLLFRIWGQ